MPFPPIRNEDSLKIYAYGDDVINDVIIPPRDIDCRNRSSRPTPQYIITLVSLFVGVIIQYPITMPLDAVAQFGKA